MNLVQTLDDIGQEIIDWARDGRPLGATANWPMSKFSSAFFVLVGYLLFIVLGFFSMRGLKPIDDATYPFRFAYNIIQVMLCSYMCIEAGLIAYRNNYPLIPCIDFQESNPPVGNLLWLFYMSKILDFADTVFIVLRKKWVQLSFLHIYHHSTIFLFYWLNLNVAYDGDVYLTIFLNGFIHTVMYMYYFVSMHAKTVWWKSSLTSLQMIQFLLMILQAMVLLVSGCTKFPRRVTITYAVYIFSLLVLFGNFFVQNYIMKKKSNKKNE